MTFAKDLATKAMVAIVATATIFSVFAPTAQAQTTEDLQQMIDDLMVQIEALRGGASTTTSSATSATARVCPYNWTRNLGTGATGQDVLKLQQFLNADPDTRLAATGVGSAGMETQYYGQITAAAVSKFQVKYRAQVLSPLGLVNPTGYFGASSRAAANSRCLTSAPPTTPTTTPPTTPGDDNDDLQGEGRLDTVEIDDASDNDIEEGEEDVEVATLTLEAGQGDIEIDRMTFTIAPDGDNAENDPWEVFDTFSVWVDGDMIAEFDASDEDNYLDEDEGEFRLSDVGLVLREDEEVEVIVAASVQSSVDGAGDNDDADWLISLDEVRYFDADGVASDEDGVGDLGETVGFFIVAEGEGDDLELSSVSEDPDATTIAVEADSSEEATIFAFGLDAGDSDSDIEIDEVRVLVESSIDVDEFVNDFTLEIDGETFDAESYTGGTSTTVTFDIDGDVVIDAGEELVAELIAEFEVDDEFETATINAEVIEVSGEGVDDVVADDAVSGETHTVITDGIIVPISGVSFESDTTGENDTIGNFDIEFEVTGFEDDFYIDSVAAQSGTAGVVYSVSGSGGTTTLTSVSAVLTSTADEDANGFFRVEDGVTETFTLSVSIDPAAAGQYRVVLEEIWYDETTGQSDLVRELTPATDYRTPFEFINN